MSVICKEINKEITFKISKEQEEETHNKRVHFMHPFLTRAIIEILLTPKSHVKNKKEIIPLWKPTYMED